jgi:hypothetical protein
MFAKRLGQRLIDVKPVATRGSCCIAGDMAYCSVTRRYRRRAICLLLRFMPRPYRQIHSGVSSLLKTLTGGGGMGLPST